MLYTPKKTLDLIRSLNCHFLVQVKKNTSKLYGSVRLFMALIKPFSETETFENSAGRAEHRRIEVFYNQASIPKRWGKFERLIRVTRWGTRNGIDYEEIIFYVSSQPIDSAKKFGQMIRQHWKIENNLHWIKDVILNEDSTTIKQTKMATQ